MEKLTDQVRVSLTPPQNAVVLCFDAKNQIQALDRIQPGLPLKPGRCGTDTLGYDRHGSTALFAVLQMAAGRVIGQGYPRHRPQDFLKFHQRRDAGFPSGKDLHLLLDNDGTPGHERVRRWLKPHPRFVLHFLPTSSSWLNLIERWFAELSRKAARRGLFRSVAELQSTRAEFLRAWSAAPAPFVWSAEALLAKIARTRQQIERGSTLAPRRLPTAIKRLAQA